MKVSPQILEKLQAWCQERPIRLCVLFGSQATGKAHSSSDVDVAVWPGESLTTATRLRWVSELENLLNRDVSLMLVSADL